MAEILDTDILSVELTVDTSLVPDANRNVLFVNAAAITGKTRKIDWGDGTIDTNQYHTYTNDGIYEIKIYNAERFGAGTVTYAQTAYRNTAKMITYADVSTETIQSYAFYEAFNIKYLRLNVKILGSTSFQDFVYKCNQLTSLTIGENCEMFYNNVVRECSSLTTIYWNARNCYGYYADGSLFDYTVPINQIIFGDSVEIIGRYTSGKATTLNSITLTGNTTSINGNAFKRTTTISKIIYLGTHEQWNNLLSNTVATGNSGFLSAPVNIVRIYTYETNGGTLEAGFDNPNTDSTYPDPLPTVTLGNFTFGGWYTDNNFITGITAGDGIDNDTIYAKLSSNITYHLNGGYNNSINNDYYTSVDTLNNKPLFAATKENYNFEGWYTESTFVNKVEDLSDYANGGDIELYAKFEPRISFKAKYKDNTIKTLPLDAQTIRGLEAYVNIDITSLETMEQLYAKIVEINAKNEHALFNFSAYIENAYCCLVRMYEELGIKYCEIIDLINGTKYLNLYGYEYSTPIDEYLETCTVEDKYSSVKISPENINSVAELINYINGLNDKGEHCFFDFSACSGVTSSAYCCTVQSYVQQGITYLFIFDMINGRLYGDYDGITEDLDTLTLGTYLDGNCETGNLLSTLTIWEGYDLAYIYRMVNRIAGINHHVILDLTNINSPEILASIGFVSDTDGMTVKVIGLTTGTIYQHKYTGSTESIMTQLESILLKNFLADYADNIATESYIDTAISEAITTTLNTEV